MELAKIAKNKVNLPTAVTPVICQYLPYQLGLKYGKSCRTLLKTVREECAKYSLSTSIIYT
jgi:hypothetical protein